MALWGLGFTVETSKSGVDMLRAEAARFEAQTAGRPAVQAATPMSAFPARYRDSPRARTSIFVRMKQSSASAGSAP